MIPHFITITLKIGRLPMALLSYSLLTAPLLGVIIASSSWLSASTVESTNDSEPTESDLDSDESSSDAPPPVDPWDSDSSFDIDGSINLLFEDFDIVITASRSAQASNMTTVPVSILTADDIHYSGVQELPQLFSFIPGMDALQLDRNRWALGVRGLHQTFSDRTLFLLNGRNISNPVHGGVDFQRLPVFIEDIKQIETVRGPGGAVWGANAFNGVINVIEKSPKETTGVMISQRYSEQGDSKTNFRVGRANNKLAWRVSGEFNQIEPTDTAYVLTGLASAPSNPRDFMRSLKLDLDAEYELSPDTSLDFGIGGTHLERGDSPFLALQLGIDERIDLIQSHIKLSHDFSPDSDGYIQWYGTYQDVNRPSMYRYNAADNNFEGQYNFAASNEHNISIGGTIRTIHLNITEPRATDSLAAGVYSEQWIGLFISDQWNISDRIQLETQARTDWYSETELDWSGRAGLLYTLGEDHKHVLRFSLAKSFRTPQTALRDLTSDRIPLGGGLFAVNLIPAGDIDNEELYSIEFGYTGVLGEGLTIRVDTYLQYYQDLTGVIELPEPAPILGRSFFTIDNIGSAKAYGLETELKYQIEKTSLSLWYAYNDFDFNVAAQNARAFRPAKHKVGATARTRVSDWLVLNANYRYTDTTHGDTTAPIKAFHRLDLTATISKPDSHAELQVGVLDVLDQTDLQIFDQTATSISQRTPGRSIFIQLHYQF